MADSNLDLHRKRFRDHDLFPLVVCVAVTAICAVIVWLVAASLL